MEVASCATIASLWGPAGRRAGILPRLLAQASCVATMGCALVGSQMADRTPTVAQQHRASIPFGILLWPLQNAHLPRRHVCRTLGRRWPNQTINQSICVERRCSNFPKCGRCCPTGTDRERQCRAVAPGHWHQLKTRRPLPGMPFLPRADPIRTAPRDHDFARSGCMMLFVAMLCSRVRKGLSADAADA
jgi:hypothetical protein